MKHFAVGWACTLNDLFIRFPYEKCKTLMTKWTVFQLRRNIVKKVFRECVHLVLEDIIENNATFKLPGFGWYGGEMHMEAVRGSDFERARQHGKFKEVDFLESVFTGHNINLYIKCKRDNFLYAKLYPVHVGSFYKDRITKYTNEGKQYG